MKKIFLGIFLAAVIMIARADGAKAIVAGLPGESDLFWSITSQLHDPMDADCAALATAEYLAAGTYGDGTAAAAGACAGMTAVLNMESTLASAGVQTNLFANSDAGQELDTALDNDWRSFDNLYFEIPSYGKIEFAQPINFMSYDFLTFLTTLTERMDMSQDYISLDADIVSGLQGYGAVLTMYNVSEFSDPEILVNEGEDTEGVVSGFSYDNVNDTIVFNAAHFTSFRAAERGSADEGNRKPNITKVTWTKYVNSKGVEMIRMSISGKRFNHDTGVTLGGHAASKIKFVSSKKIYAHFKLEKLKAGGKEKLKLKVFNGNKVKEYKNKFLLSEFIAKK